MYYFSVAGMWSWKTLAWVLVMTLGYAAGGVFFPLMRRLLPQPAKKPGNVENTQKKQLFY